MRIPALPAARRRASHLVRRLCGAQDGTTAIEFAIVMVPFLGLLLLVMQVGLYHFSLQSLEYAVRHAGRTIMTSQVSSSALTAATFKATHVCPKVFWAIDCNKLVINSFIVGKSSDAATATGVYAFINAQTNSVNAPAETPAQQRFCIGRPGDYVYLDVAYPYPNFMKKLIRTDAVDTWLVRSSTMVFNEPSKRNSGASC